LIYLVVLLLGVAIWSGSAPGAHQSGILTMLVGMGGCVWELGQWWRALRRRRAVQEREQARRELKVVRAERRTEQQAREQQQRQTHLRTARQRAQTRQAARQTQAELKTQVEAQHNARFQAIVEEASRLQTLPDTRFQAELPSLFALRGLRLQSDAPSPETYAASDLPAKLWDMRLLRLADKSVEVARSLPQGHTAAVADVEALEQWRQSEGASHAYLVSRSGFSAQAVRLAARFPVTLVEPQQLAQWQMQNQLSRE
jgi:hypothetical protein